MSVHQYKFQGLIALHQEVAQPPDALAEHQHWELPAGQQRRMVVKAENHDTHGTHFFNAMVANAGDGDTWLGNDHAIVTVSVAIEEPPEEYFGVGDHFALWFAGDVADGVVTRRLFL